MNDIDTLYKIKHENEIAKSEFMKIINNIDKTEQNLDKKLEILIKHINFINELYNQSLEDYHVIISNLINSNISNTNDVSKQS